MSGKKNDALAQAVTKRFQRAASQSFFAMVESVDEKKRTCSVACGDLKYDDVLLYATINGDLKGVHCIPKSGSQVIVSRLQGTDNLFISQYSEVESATITIGETVITVTDKGITLIKGSFGLLKTLESLCDAITKLTVSTAVGASSPPINMTDFSKIKTELKNYLEG